MIATFLFPPLASFLSNSSEHLVPRQRRGLTITMLLDFKEPLFLPFAQSMREAIDEKTDLSTVIFSGGLSQKNVDDLVKGLSGKKAEMLRRNLEYHIGQPQSNELPDHSAVIGSYTEEEAEQWIDEYEKSMSEVPADDG